MFFDGKKCKIMVFGQSHSEKIGVVMEGLPSGIQLDTDAMLNFLARRAPGKQAYATKRREADQPQFVSGLLDGKTCGAPLCVLIDNTDTRSSDYQPDLPRPGQSDFTAFAKYGESHDYRGSGKFSGRLTAPLCVAGAVCLQLLAEWGITVGAHALRIGGIEDTPFDPLHIDRTTLEKVKRADFPVLDEAAGKQMRDAIEQARLDCDSVGGIIECAALGLNPGDGEELEAALSSLIFRIPAVKGVEFGDGFACADLRGSENNDPFTVLDGKITKTSNHSGGILAGMADGTPLLFRAAVKPTPSIGKPQQTVDRHMLKQTELVIHGRHDPCIVPRAIPVVEAAAAIVLWDQIEKN